MSAEAPHGSMLFCDGRDTLRVDDPEVQPMLYRHTWAMFEQFLGPAVNAPEFWPLRSLVKKSLEQKGVLGRFYDANDALHGGIGLLHDYWLVKMGVKKRAARLRAKQPALKKARKKARKR